MRIRVGVWDAIRVFLYVILFLSIAPPAGVVINMVAFGHISRAAFHDLRKRVEDSQPEGHSAAWVRANFGEPDEVSRSGGTETWRYAPGPWYAAQFDEVVFELRNGQVVRTYCDYF